VAAKLGNTAAVCRKAYIHPRVLTAIEGLGDEATRTALCGLPTPAAPGGLSAAERRLMQLLRTKAAPARG